MSLMYKCLLDRSGLTKKDAAKLHQTSIGQVKAWMRFDTSVPTAALRTLDLFCRTADAKRDTMREVKRHEYTKKEKPWG